MKEDTQHLEPSFVVVASKIECFQVFISSSITDRYSIMLPSPSSTSSHLPSDIIKLNVRGTTLFARRDTLTCVKGSFLEAKFSGRWDSCLVRDKQGAVCLDVNDYIFKKVLEYLYIVKISDDVPPLPSVDGGQQVKFEAYVKFFALQNNEPEFSDSFKALSVASSSHTLDGAVIVDHIPDTICDITYQDHNSGGTDDIFFTNFYVNGTVLTYKKSTLCLDPTSKLAHNLSDAEWLKEHRFTTDDGTECILIEQPTYAFEELAEYLDLKNIWSDNDNNVPVPTFNCDVLKKEYFLRMVNHFFLVSSDVGQALARHHNIDSEVIIDGNDVDKLQEWLYSEEKYFHEPTLLYRASRDGWSAKDFHRLCDGKGATITVVKSVDGYIFGGYTDISWSSPHPAVYRSSSKSFLFSFRSHAGVGPMKIKMVGNCQHAVYHQASLGPVFGGGHDLCISPNAHQKYDSYSKTNFTYRPRPTSTSRDTTFFTRSENFLVEEFEVFQV